MPHAATAREAKYAGTQCMRDSCHRAPAAICCHVSVHIPQAASAEARLLARRAAADHTRILEAGKPLLPCPHSNLAQTQTQTLILFDLHPHSHSNPNWRRKKYANDGSWRKREGGPRRRRGGRQLRSPSRGGNRDLGAQGCVGRSCTRGV